MSDRQERREIDKAVAHLRQFHVENAPGEALLDEFLSQAFAPMTRGFDTRVGDAQHQVMGGDFYFMADEYLFEELATARIEPLRVRFVWA